jgi:hypothetical protein
MSNINFDKLANEYLEELKTKNPNPDNDPYKGLSDVICQTAAKVCVSILKKYDELKSKEEN